MTNEITLPEIQEFIAGFWYHYDQGEFDVLSAWVADDMQYLSRSDSGNCPFEELLAAEVSGGPETLAWLSQHRDENPYPLRHHATNLFRTGTDGEVTKARFYLYVNQVTNNVPFDVSSGVVDVGIRRAGAGLELTSMTVILDAEDSIPFAEHRAKSTHA
ncbi:polyketide cyclase [Mycobacterium sp. ITM-2016-00317]|uniref:polyketide cyclase n=1 Tax=Mycobacterium sp. ITM-2016-00317 TaxID=2099694 RepID=UPI00287FB7D8|nr:polyketide cyclase [Mycobacterium sp. ITM-2016-00317]WNG89143.1 polyketide cyclase [Mycobacterium sp. ITM-2016-00317]